MNYSSTNDIFIKPKPDFKTMKKSRLYTKSTFFPLSGMYIQTRYNPVEGHLMLSQLWLQETEKINTVH